MVRRVLLFLCAVLLIGSVWPRPSTVFANGGPPTFRGDIGGFAPGVTDLLHVRREELRFDLNPAYDQAVVTARYEMENTGPELRDFPVIFVIQDAGRRSEGPAAVAWNGRPLTAVKLDYSQLTPEQSKLMADAWTASDVVVDPVTGERHSSSTFFGPTTVRYTLFHLAVPAAGKGVLEVTYQHGAGEERTLHVNRVYHYEYLLLPAKGWASFGPLDIRVKGPDPAHAYLSSTVPMQFVDGEYRASLSGLPAENLAFGVMSRKGVIAGITEPGTYFAITFVLMLLMSIPVGILTGWLPGSLRRRGWALALGLLSGLVIGGILDMILSFLVIAAFPALSGQGYSIAIFGALQGLIAALVTTVAAGVTAGRRHRKLSA